MSAVLMTPPPKAPQRFVEVTAAVHSDVAGPDPELKKILPLMFTTTDDVGDTPDPLFIDKLLGMASNTDSAQKTMPIAAEDLTGISTYFSSYHPGVDYRAKFGTPIHAVLPGVVNEVGFERGGYGRFIVLVHHVDGKTYFSLYAHMSSVRVIDGDTVYSGEEIGEVGLTGHTTGPHLHFEIHSNNHAMDPVRFFAGNDIALETKTKSS